MKSFQEFCNEAEAFINKYKIKQVSFGLGFSEESQKWYGWTRRGLCGFGIGDMLFDENWTPDCSKPSLSNTSTDKLKFTERGSVKIENLDQAKEAAINFKKYVS